MLRTFRSKRFRISLFAIACVACPSIAGAQAPPDEAHIYAEGPTDMAIEFTACQTSDEPNCYLDFSIYRNPPGFTQAPVLLTTINADAASHTVYDLGVAANQTYTYQVCAGGYAETDRSNCLTTNTVKTPLPAPPPPGNSGGGNVDPRFSGWAPPQNLKLKAGASHILTWTNPSDQRQQTEVEAIEVLRQTGSGFWVLIKTLYREANNYVLNTSYSDPGPFLPHTPYGYEVCEGPLAPSMNNCAATNLVTTWGADPILAATRVNATTVQLRITVDSFYTLVGYSVTREGSDDPCRQAVTLGNGTQGCRTQAVGPNGVPINTPNIVTVFQTSGALGSNSSSPPWVVAAPDDTVNAGVEYYYQAHANWLGSVTQDSQVVTVPVYNRFAQSTPVQMAGGGIVTKQMGGTMQAPMAAQQAPTMTRAQAPAMATARAQAMARGALATPIASPAPERAMAAPEIAMRGPNVDLNAAMTNAQQKPGDAAALYTLGQAYCAKRLKSACISTLYMGLLQAQNTGNAALAAQIRDSLTQQGANFATRR